MNRILFSFIGIILFSIITISVVFAETNYNNIIFDNIETSYEDDLIFKFDEKTNKYGFVDKNDKLIVPYQFDDGYDFKEGLALVKKDGRFYYIDKIGNKVIGKDFRDALPFNEGVAAVSNDGKWGYIDKTGKEIISLQFEDAKDFKNGIAEVKKDGKIIYIDKKGNKTKNYELFFEVNKNGGFSFVDKNGKLIIPQRFDDGYDFKEGLAPVKIKGSYDFIDKTGKKLTNKQFRDALPFNEGLAPIRKEGKWGYIDFNGEIVIPLQFEDASQFENGIARVNTESITLIDTKGNILFNSDVPISNEEIRKSNLYSNENKILKQNELNITINGKTVNLPQHPIIENDTILVPIRGILEKLDIYVKLDNKTNKVIVQKYLNHDNSKNEEKITIEFTLNSDKAIVNGKEYPLSVAPRLLNNNILVPIKFITDNLQIDLKYNQNTKTIEF